MPSVGFVIGNGTSAEDFDLHRLVGYGTTIGCNELYKDFDPNYLVAIDTSMVSELRGLTGKQKWKLITREAIDNELWITCAGKKVALRTDINNGYINNAGLMATAFLSEILKLDEIYLVGIDFQLPTPGRDNNRYGYNRKQGKGHHVVWNMVPERNPDARFIRVGPISDADRWFYDKLQGFEFMASFEDMPIGSI